MPDRSFRELEWAVATRPRAGERESGDAVAVIDASDAVVVTAVDAVGHGPEAARTADFALQAARRSQQEPREIVTACHQALKSTRGAAIGIAHFFRPSTTLTWLAVGSMAGRLARPGDPRPPQSLTALRGVAGAYLLPLTSTVRSLTAGDVVLIASDGIRTSFAEVLPLFGPTREIASAILSNHSRATDDALVVVVRCLTTADDRDR